MSNETVVKEFPAIGRYRVRVMRSERTMALNLDVREYVSAESFQGFTRRGIRIGIEELKALKVSVDEILTGNLLEMSTNPRP